MDFSSLAPVLPLLMGPVVALVTQKVKDAPSIPVNSGNAMAIRATTMLLAVLCAVLNAWLAGSLSSLDWPQLVTEACNAIIIYASAVATYNHVPPAPAPDAQPQ
jgi:hypothetical protein